MPITLPPISRRRFLSASVAAAAALITGCTQQSRVQANADPNRFALLSDIHINADLAYTHKTGAIPWANLQKISTEVCALGQSPSSVLISGDCACLQGRPEDYATLVKALKPMRESGLPIHLALGNHDSRNNFRKALPADDARQADLADRHISIVRAPLANWYLLDSLNTTDKTPGLLGKSQLDWLAKSLDANADKPALLVLHHDLDTKGTKEKPTNGLEDTIALLEVIVPRKQVKACVYGHTHVWKHTTLEGVHMVNLPTTAWVFKETEPNGWVEATLRGNGGNFRLCALDHQHAKNGQAFDLTWR